ncbi:GmrSD restriction endonuclease domain-containing protein [Brevibacterium album]|uniref:GmrSD restriction endonuclease domain-containing protein n=1 Tax=Brevibacterium album TaxID=417948 RepID=UPI00041B080A|nr:DUF1524 domain-containing protein [Brevibacterium album]
MRKILPLALCALLTLTACESGSAETTEAVPAAATASAPAADDHETSEAATGTALEMLRGLDVKGRAPKTGYDREAFGWRDDVDHNGCDTRNDVLRRDLARIELAPDGCVVLGGSLTSDYTGDTFDFIRGDGNNIDIDHIVALSNAWQTGAQQLDDTELVALANDPLNLIAVESSLNRQKGDADAATWLPPRRDYRCEYVARQVRVKHDYELWVTPAEFDAIEGLLLDCGEAAYDEDEAWPAAHDGDLDPETSSRAGDETGTSSSGGGTGRTGAGTSGERTGTAGSGSAGSGSSGSGSSGTGSSGSSGSGGGSGSGSSGTRSEGTAGGSARDAGGAFENCTAAREAGAAPVHRGDPGYGPHLDRDGDGVGCE